MKFIYHFLYLLSLLPAKFRIFVRGKYYKSILDIHPSARIGDCYMDKSNISIGEGTYIKSGEVFSGLGQVRIGNYCAMGKNISIKARTHDLQRPTANKNYPQNLRKYGDISIGDFVWVGDNVFIRDGVVIGAHAVIGANSVVVDDVPPKAIVGGIPAKFIRYNDWVEENK